MPLLPLLIPFLLLTFLLFMERVEDVLLGQHPDEEEAARLQRDTEAGEVRAVVLTGRARPAPRRRGADASSTSDRNGRTPRTRRRLDARDRSGRPRPVRPVDDAGSSCSGDRPDPALPVADLRHIDPHRGRPPVERMFDSR